MEEAVGQFRFIVVLVYALIGVLAPAGMAAAQSSSCAQLNRTLDALNRNADFRAYEANVQKARILQTQLQGAESQFVRDGCQKAVNAGQNLSRSCRTLARNILSGRDELKKLQASIATGRAVAQQRESTLQQIARFGCTASRTLFDRQDQPLTRRNPLAEFLGKLFGNEGRIIDRYGFDYFNQSTLRTVCVRACDGYYWPVSFSTLSDYLLDDAAICQSQCPGGAAELYYYNNPGEDAEQMVNLDGVPYTAMPNAFRYRQEYDPSCTCKAEIDYGNISIMAMDEGGTSRAVVSFSTVSFPMPLRDPRQDSEVTVAEVIHIPLPRRRPLRPGEAGSTVTQAPQITAGMAEELRLITSAGKIVRIVGPDTPYVQAAATGS